MSWEANSWAMHQKMKLPQEQLVLIVLGNCADADGVAFSTWPNRDHWWKYLSRVTRLSRSSLFRHVNTIIALGLAKRTFMVLADGARRPTISLDLNAKFDYEKERERYIAALASRHGTESHHETPDDDEAETVENDSPDNEIEDENPPAENESHHETVKSASHQRDCERPTSGNAYIDSRLDSSSQDSPPTPPSGGASDPLWDRFVKAWSEPIGKFALTRSVWDDIATARRGEAITAARGYWAYRAKDPKPKAAVSAQSFLRDEAGWQQWLAYAPDGDTPATINTAYPVNSREGKAICLLYKTAGLQAFLETVMIRKGVVNYIRPMTPRIAALAEAIDDRGVILTHQQAGAWDEFIRDSVTATNRRRLQDGNWAPRPWPPRKDGTWPTAGPPTLTTRDENDDDLRNFG